MAMSPGLNVCGENSPFLQGVCGVKSYAPVDGGAKEVSRWHEQ
jgi:hypothetical protein